MRRLAVCVVATLLLVVSPVRDCPAQSYISTWKNNAKAAYSFTTDDNRSSQVYTIAPALTERRLRGTFYVNASPTRENWVDFLNIGDINHDGFADGYAHLPEQGHELGSHTSEHWAITVGNPLPGSPNEVFASYEDLAADCVAINNYIEEMTGQRVVSFAYPWGRSDPPSREVIGQHYLSGRSILGSGPANGHYIPNPPTPSDMLHLRVFNTEFDHKWADYLVYEEAMTSYRGILNDTVAAGGWAIEFIHQTGNSNDPIFGNYGNWSNVNKSAYYEHLDLVAYSAQNDEIWQDTVGNITRYIYSRDAATITYDELTDTAITLRVDDLLDDELYCEPLTVLTPVPESWIYGAMVAHNGAVIEHDIYTDPDSGLEYVRYQVVADGGLIELMPETYGPYQADYDSDGFITEADFERWREDYGTTVATPGAGADGNYDGLVNGADYSVWRDLFTCYECGVGGILAGAGADAASIPEPAAVLLFLPAAAGLVSYERSKVRAIRGRA